MNGVEHALAHPFSFLIYGLFFHFARRVLASVAHKSRRPSMIDHFRRHPLQSFMSLVGAIMGYYFLIPTTEELGIVTGYMLNQMRMTAFATGYMADNIADAIAGKRLKELGLGRNDD